MKQEQIDMGLESARDENEITSLMAKCIEAEGAGQSEYPGMTYEQGILAALRWAFEGEDDPLE